MKPLTTVGLIGDPTDRYFREIANSVAPIADGIVLRRSFAELARRPGVPLTHLITVQSARHHGDWDDSKLPPQAATARRWHVRGPLVAPPRGLCGMGSSSVESKHAAKPTNADRTPEPKWRDVWTPSENLTPESLTIDEALDRLPRWLGEPTSDDENRFSTIFVVAARWRDAEATIEFLHHGIVGGPLAIQWSRELPMVTLRGESAVIWDDSIAPPATKQTWSERVASAGPNRRHIWLSSMAKPHEIAVARQSGIAAVLKKPFRGESLLLALRDASNAFASSGV